MKNNAIEELMVPKIDEIVLDSKSSWSKPKVHPFVPMLNLHGNAHQKQEIKQDIAPKPAKVVPPIPIKKVPGFGINLDQIKKKDFHEEFMEKYDEYSESWRDMMKKQQRY